jgi:6-pyruvoyltetrahydropterin/6-carboxytetrahydropterin synthase
LPKITDRTDLVFGSTKTYTASVGLSTAFRQWRASSHCKHLHGYALEFSATFEATELNDNTWVIDFGGLKDFRKWLENMFDHTTLVAQDDPIYDWFLEASQLNIAENPLDLRIVKNTGCEAIALLTFEKLEQWLQENHHSPRAKLVRLEVREHAGNSAYVRLSNYAR